VRLRVERDDTIFATNYRKGDVVTIPIAHHDGNYFADPETLAELEGSGRVAFRYCDNDGALSAEANPNGSQSNIAGLYDDSGQVLGLMPHPERLADAALGGTDGAPMFASLLGALN
jgi:phosphoribosylformylglycinamidine synthase